MRKKNAAADPMPPGFYGCILDDDGNIIVASGPHKGTKITTSAYAALLGASGGKAGGSKGGKARARNLTAAQLSEIGRKGAAASAAAKRAKKKGSAS